MVAMELNFSLNETVKPSRFDDPNNQLKSLILAQIERWRHG
jgi:hypothetical protein